jgi:hypothetical protein
MPSWRVSRRARRSGTSQPATILEDQSVVVAADRERARAAGFDVEVADVDRGVVDRAIVTTCTLSGAGSRQPLRTSVFMKSRERERAGHEAARGARERSEVAAVCALFDVTAEDVRAASFDPSRPLGDRARSEVGTVVARVKPAQAKQLMRQLRSLIARARAMTGVVTSAYV